MTTINEIKKLSVKDLLNGLLAIDDEVEIKGWVKSRRDSKLLLKID